MTDAGRNMWSLIYLAEEKVVEKCGEYKKKQSVNKNVEEEHTEKHVNNNGGYRYPR